MRFGADLLLAHDRVGGIDAILRLLAGGDVDNLPRNSLIGCDLHDFERARVGEKAAPVEDERVAVWQSFNTGTADGEDLGIVSELPDRAGGLVLVVEL